MFKLFDDSKRIAGNESEDVAYLALFEDEVNANIFCEVLKDNNIPFMKKERGMGFTTNVILGFNALGTDIYVKRDMLDAAKELYAAFASDSFTESDASSDDKDGE